MSKESSYQEYDSIVQLMKSPEWWTWKRFLENRANYLSDRVLKLVHAKNYDEAACVEAVIFDIRKQLESFRLRKVKLEDQLSNQNQ